MSVGISASGLCEQESVAITHMKSSPSSPFSRSFTKGLILSILIGLLVTTGLFVVAYLHFRRGLGTRGNTHGQENAPIESSNSFDVFINFRGKDVRRVFVSHLHKALGRNNIITYLDDRDIKKGNKISSSLVEAIEQSKISIVVFSENYASSRWTMDELVKIMDCKKTRGQIVLPIFYKISPSKVRKKRRFSDVFRKHRMSMSRREEKTQIWTKAMAEAADLAGWESSHYRTDSQLVDVIVCQVKGHLKSTSPTSEGLRSSNPLHDDKPTPTSGNSSHENSIALHSHDELDYDYSSHDEPDLINSSHDDITTSPSPDEPQYGNSSHDDLTTPHGEPSSGSLSSHGDPTMCSRLEEPNYRSISLLDNPTNPHDDKPESGSSSHVDTIDAPLLLIEPASFDILSHDDDPHPALPSHTEHSFGEITHEHLTASPLVESTSSNLSHDDTTTSTSLDEPGNSGYLSHDNPATPEESNPLKKCMLHCIPSLLANLRDMTCDTLWRKKKRDRPIPETIQPHQPSRLSTSESFRYRNPYLPKREQLWWEIQLKKLWLESRNEHALQRLC